MSKGYFSSCQGCANRYPGCHDDCDDYQGEKEAYNRVKAMERKQHEEDAMFADSMNSRRKRSWRRP